MAAAITGNGRYFIQKLSNYIEDKLQSILPASKQYIIYNDTDSCVGGTLVTTNNGNIEIEDLYNSLTGAIEVRGEDNFIKRAETPVKAASVNSNKELEFNNITYVMKHKVKKRMYRIKCNGDEVTITEDHSMIVIRDGDLIEIKPKDVLKPDELITLDSSKESIKLSGNFEIEDLGIQEEWVYDIEVENNHNFFGNNILIHNSCYYHIEPFMARYQEQNPNLEVGEYVTWADNFEKKVIQPVIEKCIEDFATELNAYNPAVIGAEREIIADTAVFSAKKKYYARVRDSEGTRYPDSDPKIKKMGLEVVKSSTPLWSISRLEQSIPKIFDGTETDLKNWVSTLREDFRNAPLQDISAVSSVKTVEYNPLDLDKNGKPKSINIGTKSAMSHNNYINANNIEHKYNFIQSGDKTKRLFLSTPNKFQSNIVAFTNESFTNEIDCVDYDTNFEKGFLNPLQIMIESLGWDLNKKTETLDEW